MCDINKKTKLKSVVVYKVCRRMHDGKFYAYFSGMEISVGLVKDKDFYKTCRGYYNPFHILYIFKDSEGNLRYNRNYNQNIIGRTTGFKLLKTAKLFKTMISIASFVKSDNVILKLTLGGDIMQGTGEGIMKHQDVVNSVTYAGTQILNVEEVRMKDKRKPIIIPI